MEVSPNQSFKIIYSLFEHQYLGYLFESFVVALDEAGNLSLKYQNISSMNAHEFGAELDDTDYELIRLMDNMQQEAVIKKFYPKKVLPAQFFMSVYEGEKVDEALHAKIADYLETQRAAILELLPGKRVFEMANDGTPTGTPLIVEEERATVLFHFIKSETETQYYPTIRHNGELLNFQKKGGIIICNQPAHLMLRGHIYKFGRRMEGSKIRPFLQKRNIVIPRKMEETYYQKFVTQLVAGFKVRAQGFNIVDVNENPKAILTFYELPKQSTGTLFGGQSKEDTKNDEVGLLFNLSFQYGDFEFDGASEDKASVTMEKEGEEYTFYKVWRNLVYEQMRTERLADFGLKFKNGKAILKKEDAFTVISDKLTQLESDEFEIKQGKGTAKNHKKYFIGESFINVEIKEQKDWFDIHAIVRFGDFEMPFIKIRDLIVANKREFVLPNGEIAVIPESWFSRYSELFNFIDSEADQLSLRKHHLALVREMKVGNLAQVTMSRKLERLKDFSEIEDFGMPEGFVGTLRPYQKAGYNWLQFLNQYNFGGCLADDMGLGKTVQTLAMLVDQKQKNPGEASLLVMPTSLLYNWQMEAKKFAPELKVCTYTGTNRNKDVAAFSMYDLVLTSYGIARIDAEILQGYYFNYVILDESQVIKNPTSNIAKAVRTLHSRKRLILTGTPIENTTVDLWSQMQFVNPGLLGSLNFFKKEYQVPIERKNDDVKRKKLHTIIKPFILRRHKSQVATDLPKKIEHVQYTEMTDEQEELYEKTKSVYRNKIIEQIESSGMANSQFLLLQGLTLLRQIANHPKMVDKDYEFDSGKMNHVTRMLENAIQNDHKILIFSQFVKHLDILRKHLEENKIRFSYLDGTTKDRKAAVDEFQNNKEVRAFLISLKAGGVGLNLTAADYVFILDPWWNPAIEAQAIDRAHRIGQENNVFIYKFITKNTVEEKILQLQQSKMQLANELITTEESFVKKLTKEDIESILD